MRYSICVWRLPGIGTRFVWHSAALGVAKWNLGSFYNRVAEVQVILSVGLAAGDRQLRWVRSGNRRRSGPLEGVGGIAWDIPRPPAMRHSVVVKT